MKWYRTVDKLPENDKSYLVWTGQEFVVSCAHVYDEKRKQQMRELAEADFIKFQNEEQRERMRNSTGKFADFGVHWYFDNPDIYYTELPEQPTKMIHCHACGQNQVQVEREYEEEYCCAGQSNECGCNGHPTNPVFCDTCEKKIFHAKNRKI